MKVAKATHSVLNSYPSTTPVIKQGGSTSVPIAYFAIPLIVVDAPLFDCYLDNQGDPIVVPVSQVLINWSYPLLGNIPIRVYKFDALANVVNQVLETYVELNSYQLNL